MFRTVRGYLALAPPTFLAALVSYLAARPRAVSSFAVYPFLADVLGAGVPRAPSARFALVATLFFIVPYLLAGVLLFLADVGASATASLWAGRRPGAAASPRAAMLAPEALWTLAAASIVIAAVVGAKLPRVAHGGELPGGVNVAPVFVAAVPFVALGAGLLLALVASVPRAVLGFVRRRRAANRGL